MSAVGTSLLQQTIFDINYLEDHNILTVMKISLGNLAYWSFLKCFSELSEKIFVIRLKWLEPATFCIRDKDATTTPARHIWEKGSLNWTQFMLQWLVRIPEFDEFTEFNKSSALLRKKNSTITVYFNSLCLCCSNSLLSWVRIIWLNEENKVKQNVDSIA